MNYPKRNIIIVLIFLLILAYLIPVEISSIQTANEINNILESDELSLLTFAIQISPIINKIETYNSYRRMRIRSYISEKSKNSMESITGEIKEFKSAVDELNRSLESF